MATAREGRAKLLEARDGERVHILHGLQGKVIFVLLVTVGALAIFRFCEGQPQLSFLPDRFVSLKLFLLIPALGVLTFTHAPNSEAFYGLGVVFTVAYGLFAGYFLIAQPPVLFGVNVAVFIIAVFVFTWPEEKQLAGLEVLLHCFGVLWAASSLISLVLTLHLVPEYALNAPLTAYLNFRVIVGVIFAAIIFIASVGRAFQAERPNVPRIPQPPKAGDPSAPRGFLRALLHPFLISFDAFVACCWVFSNVIWLIIAMVGVFFRRIAAGVAHYLNHLIFRKRLWTGTLRIAAWYGLVYALCTGIQAVLPALQRYLITDSTMGAAYPEIMSDLRTLGIFCLLLSLGIATHFMVGGPWNQAVAHGEDQREALHRQAFASATVIVGYLCSAVMIYAATLLHLISVKGFRRFGPMTLLMAALIAFISVAFIISRWATNLANDGTCR